MSQLNQIIQFAESKSKASAPRSININRKCEQMWIKQRIEMVGKVGRGWKSAKGVHNLQPFWKRTSSTLNIKIRKS